MEKQPHPTISIRSWSTLSALGGSEATVLASYQSVESSLTPWSVPHLDHPVDTWAGRLSKDAQQQCADLLATHPEYVGLDPSVLYAIITARSAFSQAGWDKKTPVGINIGSSRGATQTWESAHADFVRGERIPVLTSPLTTLGNLSTWVAQDLGVEGPEFSHSITCSTSLHSLLNAVAWMRAGMVERFLVGGTEAALTPFTWAQMKALKLVSTLNDLYPCRALDPLKKANTMVLGEGAGALCLEVGIRPGAQAVVLGVGYATEALAHAISISDQADCFVRSMHMALGVHDPGQIDAVVMHAPGTVKGDRAELAALDVVFGSQDSLSGPWRTSHKWRTGHTFGASGALGLECALLMLKHQHLAGIPYLGQSVWRAATVKKVLVNAVGFGGNAVSILLGLPE
jgi:3-oxoacyl-[acyl-carrier-protein] synthase II